MYTSMDGGDEVINSTININEENSNINNNSITNIGAGQSIVKGKRTKRQRPQSPSPFRMITTTNSSHKSDEGSDICSNNDAAEEIMTTATTTTITIVSDDDENYFNGVGTAASTTEEEEDIANCLILLAQGPYRGDLAPQHPLLLSFVDDRSHKNSHTISGSSNNKFISRKFMEAPPATGKSGYYVYECKTCGKTFSSFQALGGHRASHKKPKNKDEDYGNKSRSCNNFSNVITPPNNNVNDFNNGNLMLSSDDEEPPFKVTRHNNNNNINSSTSLSLQLTNRALYNGITNNQTSSKGRVHECSICGAEFSSGQALGGHMRRHRGPVSTSVGAAAAPVIHAVPITAEQAAPSTDMSEDVTIPVMKIPPFRNNNSSSVLSLDLDLNLPAPQEENVGDHQSKFMLESKIPPDEQQTSSPPSPPPQQQQHRHHLVFSPALVDCHY